MSKSSIKRTLIGAATIFACLASSSSAFAGKHDLKTVQSVWIDLTSGTPIYFIVMNGEMSQSFASCVSGLRRYATKEKSIYDMAVAAKVTGRFVTVQGTGACRVWGDSEDIAWVQFL